MQLFGINCRYFASLIKMLCFWWELFTYLGNKCLCGQREEYWKMALFGLSGGGGLFGPAGGLLGSASGNNRPAPRPIIGINSSLIGLSINTGIQNSLIRASNNSTPAVNLDISDENIETPFVNPEEDTRTLTQRISEVRALTEFIDLNDERLETVEDNPDRTATFATYIALDRLRTLAEYAADEDTPETSLGQLDKQFQKGLAEIRDFINAAELDKLDLFVGDREFQKESVARLGRDNDTFEGSFASSTREEAIEGLSGNERFSVEINSRDPITNELIDSNSFEINLAEISGELSLNNIVDHINSQIESIPELDKDGNVIVDEDGNPISDNKTRFRVAGSGESFRIIVDGNILEEVTLTASSHSPSLFVSSSNTRIIGDTTPSARVTEFTNLDSEISTNNTITFAATDLDATEIAELTAELEDDDIDPAIAARRDELLSEARLAVLGEEEIERIDREEEEEEDNIRGRDIIFDATNINNSERVNAETTASQVAIDSQGNIFTVGTTKGSFGNQINTASENDIFLNRFDRQGNLVFSRLLGSSGDASGFAITVDKDDNIIIAGQTDNALKNGDLIGGNPLIGDGDAFIAKFNNNGAEAFRYQLDTFSETSALALTTDNNGDILLGGFARSAITSSSDFGGGKDGLLLRIDGSTGTLTDSNLIGSATNEQVRAVELASNGDVIVALEENGEAVIRRFSATDLTNEISSTNLGNLGAGGTISSLSIEGNTVFVSGAVRGNNINIGTINGTNSGSRDGFIVGLTDTGTTLSGNFTTYFGTESNDDIADITASNGKIFIAGTTSGILNGEESIGGNDGFVARLDATTGLLEDQQQFGAGSGTNAEVSGIAFTERGNSVLDILGLPSGTVNGKQERDIVSQTSARDGDFFYIQVEGERRRKITIKTGDTYNDLARQIRIAAFRDIDVTIRRGSLGQGLRISSVDDGKAINLIPGDEEQDALGRLGLTPGHILPQEEIFGDLDGSEDDEDLDPEDSLGGAFGLDIDGALNIRDPKTARFVLGRLDDALSEIQRADRSLEFNPFRDLLRNGDGPGNSDGPVSTRTLNQIANFQTALSRLQAGNPSAGLLI